MFGGLGLSYGDFSKDDAQVKSAESSELETVVLDLYNEWNSGLTKKQQMKHAERVTTVFIGLQEVVEKSEYRQDYNELNTLAIRLSSEWSEEIAQLYDLKLKNI